MDHSLNTNDEIKKSWKEFINSGDTRSAHLRPAIYSSWKRCYQSEVNPYEKTNHLVLSREKLVERVNANRELVDVGFPVLQNLFKFVAGTGFVVTLADKDGYLLKVVGSPEAIDFTRRSNFCEGSNWKEEYVGTNAIGLALIMNCSIQVFGCEHYCHHSHVATCSAAPIIDPDTNEIIGVVDMTGEYRSTHTHTLGMVVAAVESIQNQIALRRALKSIQYANKYKEIIMDSITDGILAIDNHGNITHYNKQFARMFDLTDDFISRPVDQLFGKQEDFKPLLNIINNNVETDDKTITCKISSRVRRFLVTSRHLNRHLSGSNSSINIFQELSRVNKLITQVQGENAKYTFDDIIGHEPSFKEIIEFARNASKSECNVLILGESGTGKDIVAQAIHNENSHGNHPFIAINCAAIPKEMLASELFGYEEGAFTGAKKGGNPGKFELATGGTLFLDEIGEMPLELQTYLLRVIEEKTIMRIGGNKTINVDVRIIAATNKNLVHEVTLGNFRSDLYYRLNVITLQIPPLRHRKEDIPLLVDWFVKQSSQKFGKRIEKISHEVLQAFFLYEWPGNVRELQNVIERMLILSPNTTVLTEELLPLELKKLSQKEDNIREENTMNNLEKSIIINYLDKYRGNKRQVADKLGIARSTLYRKMEKYKLHHHS